VTYLSVDDTSRIDPQDLRKAITPRTVLISIMHANNEVGTIQPIDECARIAGEHGVAFHTDAAQSVGKISTNVRALGVDFLSVAGHNVYAPNTVPLFIPSLDLAGNPAPAGVGMGLWLLHLPVLLMGAIILGLVYLGTAIIYWTVMSLAKQERMLRAFKAISPGMLPPISVVFALLVGFMAAQVWSDSDKAHTAVDREAGALRDAVLLSTAFPEAEHRFKALIRSYIQDAVSQEWPAMGRQEATLTLAPARLSEALRLALGLQATTPGQVDGQREMVSAVKTALDARRDRIILSSSRVNWVKWTVLIAQAAVMLVAIAMVHCDNPLANKIILTIFATSVAVAMVLVASHARPFTGQISVAPTYLLQVLPEADAKAGP
jgi:hypothetical protein